MSCLCRSPPCSHLGSHEELMRKRGLYYKLYTAQVQEEAA